MAGTNRHSSAALIDIKRLLLEKGNSIPYVQVIRLLHLFLRKQHKELDDKEIFNLIRVRPHLALEFPGTDVVSVKEIDKEAKRFQITATFLGLYGSSSPLPTFYTEDLIEEEREDRSGSRDFLDLINQQFYNLYYRVWEKYAVSHRLSEDYENRSYLLLFSLLGIADPETRNFLRHDHRFLSYIGLACQHPRSAEGLRALLAGMLRQPSVSVHQCVEYQATIPMEQRAFLGVENCRLGDDAHVGSLVRDRMGKFKIHIGPVSADAFQDLLPGRADHALLLECVRFYCDQSLLWELDLKIKHEEMETCQPGNPAWGSLGWNAWLFSGTTRNNGCVRFWGGEKANAPQSMEPSPLGGKIKSSQQTGKYHGYS